MRHSGWYPDRVTRLFRRTTAHFSDDLVHERLVTERPIGQLRSQLLHESFRNFEAVLDKANRYSTAGAQSLLKKRKTASVGKAVGHGMGCTVGQGLSGISTLSFTSFVALAAILAGCVAGLKYQIWRLERSA